MSKYAVTLPPETLAELREQADKMDRSVSWVMQQAWRVAKSKIKTYGEECARAQEAKP